MQRARGFTLVEIVIAVAILSVVLLMAVPSLSGVIADRKLRASLDSFNNLVRQALERVDAPAAAGLAAAAKTEMAKAEPGPRPDDVAAAGEMTDAQRSQMIRGMVDRLASRLHENGADLDGWLRLLRAYKVLGENAKAKEAVAEARAALANEPDKLRRLDAAIKDLDIGG